jgi:hypothetical protein
MRNITKILTHVLLLNIYLMSIRAVGGDTTTLFDDYGNETGKNKLII